MYRIAICDDNKEDLVKIRKFIIGNKQCPNEVMISEYLSGRELLDHLGEQFDLIFLDIQMKDMDGNKTSIRIREMDKKVMLVFCTGVEMPTPEMFKVSPYRYLMKYYSRAKWKEEITDVLIEMKIRKKEKYIEVVNDGKKMKILVDDIRFISILKRYTKVHVSEDGIRKIEQDYVGWKYTSNNIYCSKKLPDLYEELKSQDFEYAHNSYIVNLNYVVRRDKKFIKLNDGLELNLSRGKQKNFDLHFAEFLGSKYRRKTNNATS